MDSIFWAGLIGAAAGAALGVYSKQRGVTQSKGALYAAGTAIAIFVVLTAIFALF